MSRVPGRQTKAARVLLPSRVLEAHFELIVARLRAGGLETPFVLDLRQARHVDYRALRRFARRLRREGLPAGSVSVAGASDYVLAIFEYALSAEDWPLFDLPAPGSEPATMDDSLAERLVRAAGFGPN